MMENRSCDTCRYYLGGGQCAVSLEHECKDGDYEAWEEKENARQTEK